MSDNPFEPGSVDALPELLAIFPLAGATLLPRTQLPLNIFEPRYINMILDALGAGRLIGMVQPAAAAAPVEPVPTYAIGCAGRIVAFNETGDGRLLISLQGVCRFRLGEELPLHRGYRRVRPIWTPFAADLAAPGGFVLDRGEFRGALDGYLDSNGIRVDWDALEKMSDEHMVDFLAMHLPLTPEEKQLLVEAPDTAARARDLMAVTRMAAGGEGPADCVRH